MRNVAELHLNEGGEPVTRPAPTAQQISVVEQLIGTSLPHAYLAFLQISNGGHPELDTFSSALGGQWAVNTFFHIASDAGVSDDWEGVVGRYHRRWPQAHRELLPIADDGGDNLYCLDLGPTGCGRVVVQLHDEPGFPQVPLAAAFEDFIDGLDLNPDYI